MAKRFEPSRNGPNQTLSSFRRAIKYFSDVKINLWGIPVVRCIKRVRPDRHFAVVFKIKQNREKFIHDFLIEDFHLFIANSTDLGPRDIPKRSHDLHIGVIPNFGSRCFSISNMYAFNGGVHDASQCDHLSHSAN